MRKPQNLTGSGRAELARLLAANAEIEAACILKDCLKLVRSCSYRRRAERRLLSRARIAIETGVKELKRFARGLLKAKEGFLAFCKHRITSAKIGVLNRKAQRVLCKTCGVSNRPGLLLKLRQETLQT